MKPPKYNHHRLKELPIPALGPHEDNFWDDNDEYNVDWFFAMSDSDDDSSVGDLSALNESGDLELPAAVEAMNEPQNGSHNNLDRDLNQSEPLANTTDNSVEENGDVQPDSTIDGSEIDANETHSELLNQSDLLANATGNSLDESGVEPNSVNEAFETGTNGKRLVFVGASEAALVDSTNPLDEVLVDSTNQFNSNEENATDPLAITTSVEVKTEQVPLFDMHATNRMEIDALLDEQDYTTENCGSDDDDVVIFIGKSGVPKPMQTTGDFLVKRENDIISGNIAFNERVSTNINCFKHEFVLIFTKFQIPSA